MANKGRQEKIAARRAEVMRMRAEGMPDAVIAARLRISEPLVRQDAYRVLQARKQEMREHSDLLLANAVDRTERIAAALWAIAREEHVKVSNSGRVVVDEETGQKVPDRSPNTAALSQLLRAEERLAKLLGVDASAKLELTNKLTVEQATEVLDAEIARMRVEVERYAEDGGNREVELEQQADQPGHWELPPAESRTALDRLGIQPED